MAKIKVSPLPEILQDLKKGRIILVMDDEKEQEADLVIAGDFATPDKIAFLMKYGLGLLCLPVTQTLVEKFQLPLLPKRNNDAGPSYLLSLDENSTTKTGISSQDYAQTIATLINDNSTLNSIKTPGHLFPILAQPEGVLSRPGHTEAAIDLMKLAGLKPLALLSELMNSERNQPANLEEIEIFAEKFQLKIITIRQIIEYRKANEL